MKREQGFFVVSCYSNSNGNVGWERERIQTYISKQQKLAVSISLCEKAAAACVRSASQCCLRAYVKHVLLRCGFVRLKSIVSVFAACLYLRHALH